MMKDGDVDGDECWSNVIYPQFDVFFHRRFASGLVPGRQPESRGIVFSHAEDFRHTHVFTHRSFLHTEVFLHTFFTHIFPEPSSEPC